MFWPFKQKKVNQKWIKEFNSWVKAIKLFIELSDWEKAKQGIMEISIKEKKSMSLILKKLNDTKTIDWLDIEDKKIEFTEELKEKQLILDKLKIILIKKEDEYNNKLEKERLKIRFNRVKHEIEILLWDKQADEALSLLRSFLDEFPSNTKVINFYNIEKEEIIKTKEDIRQRKEKNYEQNAKLEAESLIWDTVNINKDSLWNNKPKWFWSTLRLKLNFYKNIKSQIEKKQLMDEVNMLIEEDTKVNNDLAARKLANIHKWMVKEIFDDKMIGYQLYWKILWADKISWDTIWLKEDKDKYSFFLWDATWHWIRAWFIITQVVKFFNQYVKTTRIQELAFLINNKLKQNLKLRNFITSVIFEISKKKLDTIKFVWLWHEPLFIYRKSEDKIEKIIPGWLAAWIRLMKNITDVKVQELNLINWDIIMTYSDWLIEAKSDSWEMFWLEWLQKTFYKACLSSWNIKDIYSYILSDIKTFKWWSQFLDDLSIMLLKKDKSTEILDDTSSYKKELQKKEKLTSSDMRKLRWHTVLELNHEIKNLKKDKEMKMILKKLDNLYVTWEVLKLKQQSIKYIKEWFIDKKINKYLKTAINNEKKYKLDQKNQKITNKYNVLEELFSKWEFDAVISEIEEVITNDWNI